MNKRLLAGIFLAVVASAVTASIVVVIGQGEGPLPEIGPNSALRPSEITKLPPGTLAVGLTDPVDHGPFRILPAGTAPPERCGLPPPPGLTADGLDIRDSATLDEFRGHPLFFEPPYVPAGWKLTNAHAESVVWNGGSRTGSLFVLRYSRPDYFDIFIRRALKPDCTIQIVEPLPEGQHAYTLGEIRGVPVVYMSQAPGETIQANLEVHFVIDGLLTSVDSVAIDFDELIKIADALIAEFQQAPPPAP